MNKRGVIKSQTLKNSKSLEKLLIMVGKGRRSVERQSGTSPHLTNNSEVLF